MRTGAIADGNGASCQSAAFGVSHGKRSGAEWVVPDHFSGESAEGVAAGGLFDAHDARAMNNGSQTGRRQEETNIARDATTPGRIEDAHMQRARAESLCVDVFLRL